MKINKALLDKLAALKESKLGPGAPKKKCGTGVKKVDDKEAFDI
jgi:hypothetical protein